MPNPNTMDIHAATKLMFNDDSTWPGLALPIKNYNIRSSHADPFADNGIMFGTENGNCLVILGCNIFCKESVGDKKTQNIPAEKLIADGWVVD